MRVRLFAVLVLLTTFGQLNAVVVNGGRGLSHTKAAWTTRAGHLTAMGNLRIWGKKSTFTNKTLAIETGSTIWVVQGLANVTYGINKHTAVSFTPILYQDAHKLEGEEILWDSFLSVKFGSYKLEKQPFWLGFDIGCRLPTGKNHNIIFEDYTAGRFEFGLTGLITYRYTSPNLQNDFRIHANLGYWNYNDRGIQLMKVNPDERGYVTSMSQSLNYAFGVDFPTRNFEYGLELYGLGWIVVPPPAAASRENYLYMNVSFTYKPQYRFSFFTNVDLHLMPASDTTSGLSPELPGMPSYPGWRINLGMKYLILPKSVYDMHKTSFDREKNKKTKRLYTQLEKEIEKIEKSKQELARLQKEKEKSTAKTNQFKE